MRVDIDTGTTDIDTGTADTALVHTSLLSHTALITLGNVSHCIDVKWKLTHYFVYG